MPGVGHPDGPDWFPDRCTPLIAQLSRRFDEVQYFGTHRIVGYHAWAKAERGRIVRVYAYLGEQGVTLWDRGEKTPAEQELGFNFVESLDEAEEIPLEELSGTYPDEESVMQVAGKWSVDPQSLDRMDIEPGLGVLGDLGPKYHRLDGSRLRLREYLRMCPGPIGLIGWAAKLVRKPIQLRTYIPEPGTHLYLEYDDLPIYVRQEIEPHVKLAEKHGQSVRVIYTIPALDRNEGFGVYSLNGDGTIATLITFARSRHDRVPRQQCLVSLMTPLDGDELLVTSNGRSGYDLREGVHLEAVTAASVDQTWQRHNARIDNAAQRIAPVQATEQGLIDFLVQLERADFRYKLARGLYVEMSQNEVDRIRARG